MISRRAFLKLGGQVAVAAAIGPAVIAAQSIVDKVMDGGSQARVILLNRWEHTEELTDFERRVFAEMTDQGLRTVDYDPGTTKYQAAAHRFFKTQDSGECRELLSWVFDAEYKGAECFSQEILLPHQKGVVSGVGVMGDELLLSFDGAQVSKWGRRGVDLSREIVINTRHNVNEAGVVCGVALIDRNGAPIMATQMQMDNGRFVEAGDELHSRYLINMNDIRRF